MSTNTEISNLAISFLGIGHEIQDLDTDRSQEAAICRTWFDVALESTQSDFLWPFTTKYASLQLIENAPMSEFADSFQEWQYSYQYPSDCISFRKILSGTRNDNRQSRIPFEIIASDTGMQIYTDMQFAIGKYSKKVTENQVFSPQFVIALAMRLAGYVAPGITGGDPFKKGDTAMKMYQMEGSKAESNFINQNQDEEVPDSEFIRARS